MFSLEISGGAKFATTITNSLNQQIQVLGKRYCDDWLAIDLMTSQTIYEYNDRTNTNKKLVHFIH